MHFFPSLSKVRGLFLQLCLLLALAACAREDSGGAPVAWPELVRFDEIAYRADGLARTGDLGSVSDLRTELIETGQAVTPSTIPANVANPREVETILADLTGLVEGISATADPESTAMLVLGLHPVIERLITAAGMPHVHANEGPNQGFLQPVFDSEGTQVGTAEVKLHDDAGDLEIWLTVGGYGGDPWRLDLDTTLLLNFPGLEREVTLAVRDRTRNEDESGESTIVDGTTSYFVFPGDTGIDASWLMGAEFAAKAELQIEDATTGAFVLRPHVHRADGDGAS
ncbi:MAG: hypothetical protein CMJ27_06910 [Phycisphaerae bacterium]|nr:hypothetical protein [Phycisphaerae bacterium]OUX01434.1 MAG: hypothetical protein CBD91_04555 [Phycisphaeraceae bacterium TMED231]